MLLFIKLYKIDQVNINEELRNKCKSRIIPILKTERSGGNKIKIINTYAVPVLTYSFGIIKWSGTELEKLNILKRLICNKYRIHHTHKIKILIRTVLRSIGLKIIRKIKMCKKLLYAPFHNLWYGIALVCVYAIRLLINLIKCVISIEIVRMYTMESWFKVAFTSNFRILRNPLNVNSFL